MLNGETLSLAHYSSFLKPYTQCGAFLLSKRQPYEYAVLEQPLGVCCSKTAYSYGGHPSKPKPDSTSLVPTSECDPRTA